MSLRGDGYLDLAFVAPDWRGKGVAKVLHGGILAVARAKGLACLSTEASRMARSFFLRMGWHLIAAQHLPRNGQVLENFRMKLPLRPEA